MFGTGSGCSKETLLPDCADGRIANITVELYSTEGIFSQVPEASAGLGFLRNSSTSGLKYKPEI